uniref:Fe2OG dioxygenase domain-containing protein n=1 Tax=Rhabditophanes sp. KR3021 TaxID=114890 RepID=A0AC35UBZ2_9BILA
MLKCRGCQTTVYCGREHLTSDWDNHKKQCKSGSGLKRDRLQDSKPSSPISTEDKESETVLREQKKFIDHNLNVGFTKSLSDFTNLLALEGKEYNITDIHIRRCKAIAESVMNNLKTYGWATVDSFLGENHCLRTNNEVDGLYKRGLFNAGQLMDKQEKTVSHDIRSDQIYWYNSSDPQTQDLVQTRLLVSMIDSIVSHFGNKIEPYNISGRSRAMIAVYPGHGTKYVKHVDNPTNDGRCITAIYYCNQNWIMKLHGGALRLYPETSKTPIDIDPQADKLVVFWSSAQVPHEVMPVYRERFAITIWYFDKAEKEAAQNNKQLGDSGSSNDRKRGTSDDEDSPLSKILKNKMAKNQSHSF